MTETAVCTNCKGSGTEADYVGLEMRCVEVECSRCKGAGVEPSPAVPEQTVIPEDLRPLYKVCAENIEDHSYSSRVLVNLEAKKVQSLIERIARAEATVAELDRELREERGLKALLANGMPPTGNSDFDEVLATWPIAAIIQRGWLTGITGFDDLPALERAICHFLGVKTIAEAVNPPFPFARATGKES